jgi:hypothetical protein
MKNFKLKIYLLKKRKKDSFNEFKFKIIFFFFL